MAGMGGPTTGSSRPFSNRAIAGRYQSAQELSEAGSDRDAKEHGFFSPPHRRHSRCAMFPCRATGTARKPFGRRDSTRPIPERLAIFSVTASLGGIFVNLLTSCRADHRRLSRHTRRLKVTLMFRLFHGITRIFATMNGRLKVVSDTASFVSGVRSCWLETTTSSDTGPMVGRKPSEEGKSNSFEPEATTCLSPFERSMRMTRSFNGSAA